MGSTSFSGDVEWFRPAVNVTWGQQGGGLWGREAAGIPDVMLSVVLKTTCYA